MTTAAAETLPDTSTESGRMIGWLGLSCMAAAVLTGLLSGSWELASPNFSDPQTFDAAPVGQRLGHGLLEVIKTVGFLAGIFGFWLAATRRGSVTKVFLALAVLGGVFYTSVQMWNAITGTFTLLYVVGGLWYQMIAPVALGIAALAAGRASRWKAAWPIAVGLINSQIFALFAPGYALILQGIIWLIFGAITYTLRTAK
jgi:hypothetical protein